MIELYETTKKGKKTIGFVDGTQYLNNKKKPRGSLDGKQVKDKQGMVLLQVDDAGNILLEDGEECGGKLEGTRIVLDSGAVFLSLSDEKDKILREGGEVALNLEGDVGAINDLDFFGIVTIFLELFA